MIVEINEFSVSGEMLCVTGIWQITWSCHESYRYGNTCIPSAGTCVSSDLRSTLQRLSDRTAAFSPSCNGTEICPACGNRRRSVDVHTASYAPPAPCIQSCTAFHRPPGRRDRMKAPRYTPPGKRNLPVRHDTSSPGRDHKKVSSSRPCTHNIRTPHDIVSSTGAFSRTEA